MKNKALKFNSINNIITLNIRKYLKKFSDILRLFIFKENIGISETSKNDKVSI